MVDFSLVKSGDKESLIIILDGSPKTVSTQHPNYDAIKEALSSDETEEFISNLYNANSTIPDKLQRLSERIILLGGKLHFDGDVIDNSLSRHIVRLAQVGDKGLSAFVKFMENLAQNPSHLSRVHLFAWIDNRDFTITEDGYIVGYKAVNSDGNGSYLSITSGTTTVFVDGNPVTGHVPNPIGAVVEVPRTQVDSRREAECSYGLHVGTWGYASKFGGPSSVVLKVIVNPRDVVAVPRDEQSQKMRVCRYTIEEVINEEINTPVIFTSTDDSESEFDGPIFDDDYTEDADENVSLCDSFEPDFDYYGDQTEFCVNCGDVEDEHH